MRLLTRLLATCLLAFTAIAATAAEDTPLDLRTHARLAGLPDDVDLQEVESDNPNGGFWRGGVVCMFGIFCTKIPPFVIVQTPADWPREYKLAVLFHEVGHYHQARAGLPAGEWDADVRSIRELCRQGYNGPQAMAGALADIVRRGRLQIDSTSHGNAYARVQNARARDCSGELRAEGQSPLMR